MRMKKNKVTGTKITKFMLKIICVVKFVPDVDSFSYDYENGEVNRSHARMILNPDDSCALAFALKVKEKYPNTHIRVVSMAPRSVMPHLMDLVRLPVDVGILISDPAFAGSDTYITSEILGRYISSCAYDCILTGSRALDGATSHVPVQLAEKLDLEQMLDIIHIDLERFDHTHAVFQVEENEKIFTYEMAMPGVLSVSRTSNYKLPYASYEDLQRDVSQKISIVTNTQLDFAESEVGLAGSLTKVAHTYAAAYKTRKSTIVQTDDAGIAYVHAFLKKQGYV
jgi:electron transfer flavoprotein beta subunit